MKRIKIMGEEITISNLSQYLALVFTILALAVNIIAESQGPFVYAGDLIEATLLVILFCIVTYRSEQFARKSRLFAYVITVMAYGIIIIYCATRVMDELLIINLSFWLFFLALSLIFISAMLEIYFCDRKQISAKQQMMSKDNDQDGKIQLR